MPIKDDEARRAYFRDYMRKRRAGEPAAAKPTASAQAARIGELEAEVARLRARIAELEPKHATPPPFDRAAFAARLRADAEAHARECAQWGGRPKAHVITDIKRLLSKGGLPYDHVPEAIINAMLPHVREQANIERGISRRTYRKVLADLHTDRNAASTEAFVAFKALDAKRPDGQPNPRSIVIADDKVRTMADYQRKREERSANAKAAAAKRKAKT